MAVARRTAPFHPRTPQTMTTRLPGLARRWTVMRSSGRLISGVDQSLEERRETAARKVVVANPFGRDRDAGHLLVNRPHLCREGLGLVGTHGPSGRGQVFLRHAVDDVDLGD